MILSKMNENEYRMHEYFGFHDIVALTKSFWHMHTYRKSKLKKDYQNFGAAAHIMALEPERFKTDVVILPEFNRRTKDGKAKAEEFEKENSDKIIVTEDEMIKLVQMQETLEYFDLFRNIRRHVSNYEACAFYEFSDDLKLKGRIDAAGVLPDGSTFILEYKTTQDASFDSFKYDIHKYKYDLQLFHYATVAMQGVQNALSCRLFIVAQEKEPPYDYTLTEVEVSEDLVQSYYDLLALAERNIRMKSGYSKNINEYHHRRQQF